MTLTPAPTFDFFHDSSAVYTGAFDAMLNANRYHSATTSQSGEPTQFVGELLYTQNLNERLPLTMGIVRRRLKNEFPEDFLP